MSVRRGAHSLTIPESLSVSMRRFAIGAWAVAAVLWAAVVVWQRWLERPTVERVVPDRVFARWQA